MVPSITIKYVALFISFVGSIQLLFCTANGFLHAALNTYFQAVAVGTAQTQWDEHPLLAAQHP